MSVDRIVRKFLRNYLHSYYRVENLTLTLQRGTGILAKLLTRSFIISILNR